MAKSMQSSRKRRGVTKKGISLQPSRKLLAVAKKVKDLFGKDAVGCFRGDNFFLSNHYMADNFSIDMDGMTFPSSEHCYMAAKTLDRAEREKICHARSPGQAKRLARKLGHKQRKNWYHVQEDVMLEILRRKFSHLELAEKLLSTGDTYLVEGNTWGDTWWGMAMEDGKLEGYNRLGHCLMRVRKELKDGAVQGWRCKEIELLRCR